MFKLHTAITSLFLLIISFTIFDIHPLFTFASENSSRITPVVKAVEESKFAVVNISTYEQLRSRMNPFSRYRIDPFFERFFDEFYEPRYQERSVRTSLGSGVIIYEDGYVVTNWHVVEHASEITVTTIEDKTYEAVVVGTDPKSDLAVLKIQSDLKFPKITLGDSEDILIGETVIAIGNPFGLSNTVTTGVVSALHRSIKKEDQVYEDFVQTDASINPGNSGGPLLNINGELIGINTAIYGEAQGIGFAIPINTAKRIVDDLLQYGEVIPAWLGIYVQDLTDQLAKHFGYEGNQGVVISEIFPNSPAQQSGLKEGDIILSVNKQKIKSKESFERILSTYTANNRITITYFRNNKTKKVQVVTSEFPWLLARLNQMGKLIRKA
jgi:Do/DeqQ family serine protease